MTDGGAGCDEDTMVTVVVMVMAVPLDFDNTSLAEELIRNATPF